MSIYIKSSANLHFETIPAYTLTVRCEEALTPSEGTASLIVLLEENSAPEFNNFQCEQDTTIKMIYINIHVIRY